MVLPVRRWMMLAVALVVLALALPRAAQAGVCGRALSMATGQWEPYGYYDAGNRFTGIDADMVRAIVKEAGCQLVELDYKPALRNLALFEKGEIDLMTGASRTPARLKIAWFSQAYRDETVGMFALAEHAGRYAKIRSFADFLAAPLTLVVPRAGWYGVPYESAAAWLHKSGRLSRFGEPSHGIQMLALVAPTSSWVTPPQLNTLRRAPA